MLWMLQLILCLGGKASDIKTDSQTLTAIIISCPVTIHELFPLMHLTFLNGIYTTPTCQNFTYFGHRNIPRTEKLPIYCQSHRILRKLIKRENLITVTICQENVINFQYVCSYCDQAADGANMGVTADDIITESLNIICDIYWRVKRRNHRPSKTD